MSVGRKEAFELFVRDYPENELIEENKKGLKMRLVNVKSSRNNCNLSFRELFFKLSKSYSLIFEACTKISRIIFIKEE